MSFEERVRQAQFKEATGAAMSFTAIDGIGPKTAEKIKSSDYGVNAPQDIQDMSADELSDKAGISRTRAEKAIRGAGGNPSQSKRSSTGSVSAAGITQRVGDFRVEFTDLDKARARNDAYSRSEEAVTQDERKRAPITTDLDRWKSSPGRYDFPGVDTPTQEPDLLPKDLQQREKPTTDFGNDDADDVETFPRKRDAASGKKNFILETGEERLLASEFTSGLDQTAPGLAPEDFEDDPGPRYPSKTLGRRPSSQSLPEDAFQNLASGEKADLLFTEAEEKRSSNNTPRLSELDDLIGL